MIPVKAVTTRPLESTALTCTGGLIVLPNMALLGCVVNARRVAGAGRMANAARVEGLKAAGLK